MDSCTGYGFVNVFGTNESSKTKLDFRSKSKSICMNSQNNDPDQVHSISIVVPRSLTHHANHHVNSVKSDSSINTLSYVESVQSANDSENTQIHVGSAMVAVIGTLAAWTSLKLVNRVRRTRFVKKRTGKRDVAEKLHPKIAQFYDLRSAMWERVWGEHMHHGFYGLNESFDAYKNPQKAQIDMMHQLLSLGDIDALKSKGQLKILDVGCGIGGSVRFLATQLVNATVQGVTLSPEQVKRANEINASKNLNDRAHVSRGDAMELPFDDSTFDVVWSLESAEHFPDKFQFIREAFRVLKPGGTLLMAAWCHRSCPPALSVDDRYVLENVYEKYCVSHMCSLDEFKNYALRAKFRRIETADWTAAVKPFWRDVVKSAVSMKGVKELVSTGIPAIESALAMRHMIEGFNRNTIVFGVMTARKPYSHELEQEDRLLEALTCRSTEN
mmetsp:Transcript_1692/g.2996  ORF Transcript_1692/g.2996 Transcript_1692/m.2996 type:complete len:442 (-) Transcript_1692:322-1647(-)